METLRGIADYEFEGVIGAGSSGCYYRARRPQRIATDEDVLAVKVLRIGDRADAFRRIARELRVFASVRSSYLVRLFDAGRDGDTFYYAMEYFPAGSLATAASSLPRTQILRAVADAARAAHDLHEAGVAHRGIRPSKVLVLDSGARLSDLAVAQILAPGQTVTGLHGFGSFEYTDPRVLNGAQASRASDVWSLGATLHRSLTGTGLYGELSVQPPAAALRAVLGTAPRLAEGLLPDERAVIAACIDPEPTARPRSALEVAARIDALL